MKIFILVLMMLLALHFAVDAKADEWSDHTSEPVASSISRLLNAINSGNQKLVESFVKNNFHADLLDAFPMNSHVDYILGHHFVAGKLSIHSVKYRESQSGENFFVTLQSEKNRELVRFCH